MKRTLSSHIKIITNNRYIVAHIYIYIYIPSETLASAYNYFSSLYNSDYPSK